MMPAYYANQKNVNQITNILLLFCQFEIIYYLSGVWGV